MGCTMMDMLEEAIICATVLHQGKVRKFSGVPYILHPIELAQILSTMTNDQEVITAGILHDVVEDTDGTLAEIERRFGERVAQIVASESEEEYPSEDRRATWRRRKEGSLNMLRNSDDIGVQQLWLADKLANIRSLAREYSEQGDSIWAGLNQGDPAQQRWYYRSVGEAVELQLNRTGAFKEYIKHVNFIWPGTLVHGDFHTGNVVLQKGEPLIIDMDRIAIGHPITEIADLRYFYVTLGEQDPSVVEDFAYVLAHRTAFGFARVRRTALSFARGFLLTWRFTRAVMAVLGFARVRYPQQVDSRQMHPRQVQRRQMHPLEVQSHQEYPRQTPNHPTPSRERQSRQGHPRQARKRQTNHPVSPRRCQSPHLSAGTARVARSGQGRI